MAKDLAEAATPVYPPVEHEEGERVEYYDEPSNTWRPGEVLGWFDSLLLDESCEQGREVYEWLYVVQDEDEREDSSAVPAGYLRAPTDEKASVKPDE